MEYPLAKKESCSRKVSDHVRAVGLSPKRWPAQRAWVRAKQSSRVPAAQCAAGRWNCLAAS